MQDIAILSASDIGGTAIKRLIAEWNGYWNAESTLDQGVVEDGAATVYVSYESIKTRCDLAPAYEEEQVDEIETALGGAVATLVDIHIGHAEGSLELAQALAAEIVRRWGGFIDQEGI